MTVNSFEPQHVVTAEAFSGLSPEWPDTGLREEIRRRLEDSGTAVVVVDDDPTGTQTVHDVPVLTDWAEATLRGELNRGEPAFYILTNSRALDGPLAAQLALELGQNLAAAAAAVGRRVEVISRSDSTLRGHYPAETDALAAGLGIRPDGLLVAPYFREGGRFTIGDVHYVQEGERLTPAARTEFARDHTFGYTRSNLREWIEEKTKGRWKSDEVAGIGLETIRIGGPVAVQRLLEPLRDGRPVVVNAVSDRDLEVVVMGLMGAEEMGKRYLCRTAASFAKVRAGISDSGLLKPERLLVRQDQGGGGLAVVGSYVPRTTRQLEALMALPDWHALEVAIEPLLDPRERDGEIARVREAMNTRLARGENVVVCTSRGLVSGGAPAGSLGIGQSVSAALVEIVASLPSPPRFLIAKGGITSSDLATRALGVRRARVMGQIAPGVPVWELGAESRFPGLAYVVFPGNVGTDDTLAEIARSLSAAGEPG